MVFFRIIPVVLIGIISMLLFDVIRVSLIGVFLVAQDQSVNLVSYTHIFFFFFVCPSFWKWNRWNVQDWGKSQGSPDTITNTGWHRPGLDGPPTPCHGFGRPFIRRTQWEVLYQSISDSPDLVKYSPHPRMMQLSRSETFNEKVNWKWHPFQLNLLISGRLPQEDEKS